MYHSTRSKKLYTSKEALIKGLADDNGLFVIDKIPSLAVKSDMLNFSYKDFARSIFKLYLDDFTDSEIEESINMYDDVFLKKECDEECTTDYGFLKLYLGPTFAFKDMALTVLPKLIEIAKRSTNDNRKTVVLTATSGDTGSAALSGFSKIDNNSIFVLYPNNKTSNLQEQQMLFFNNDTNESIAVDGTFDDCQNIVKDIFNTVSFNKLDLISANSINIGRLIPQIVYYYKAYMDLVNDDLILFNEKINVVVPTGNFGNILALILAYKMGLPVNKICCASNENNILTKFFNTGIYDANRKFIETNSPAMDILVSSNLERFLYLVFKDESIIDKIYSNFKKTHKFGIDLNILNKEFPNIISGFANRNETIDSIKEVHDKNKILIDPHTAVGYKVYKDNIKNLDNVYTLIVATASPYKFSKSIAEALNIKYTNELDTIEKIYKKTGFKVDDRLFMYLKKENEKHVLKLSEVKKYLIKKLGELNDKN